MRSLRPLIAAALLLAGALLLALAPAGPAQDRPAARSVELTGTIDPATAAWVETALEDAREAGAPLVILRMDTPGGLDTSMREIIRDVIAAPMPVVVYVAPDGARAASAGLFITMAADVAAMAPQTNIGSATPVMLGGGETDEVLGRKIRNDAAAYVRALAEAHDRNADLAERMVRDAVNVPAAEAERENLIDLVAADRQALLEALDGLAVAGPKAQTLDTDGLDVVDRDMPLQYEIQQVLVNPTVAYLLLLAGVLGLAFEVFSPGLIGPGLFGAVALVLGLYGSAQLPVTAAGVVLLLLGVGLLVAELFVAGVGLLAAAGLVALVGGGLLLFDTDSEVFQLSVPVAIAVGAGLGSLTVFALSKAMQARHAPPRGGMADLVGEAGTVRVPLEPLGQVLVHGELWKAEAADEQTIPAGARVRVRSTSGFTLTVEPDPEQHDKEHP